MNQIVLCEIDPLNSALHETTSRLLDITEDMLSGLKEMIHYAKSNIEKLSEFWLFMEDEVKRKEFAEKIDDLLDKQTSLHSDLEERANEIQTEINKIRNEGGDPL